MRLQRVRYESLPTYLQNQEGIDIFCRRQKNYFNEFLNFFWVFFKISFVFLFFFLFFCNANFFQICSYLLFRFIYFFRVSLCFEFFLLWSLWMRYINSFSPPLRRKWRKWIELTKGTKVQQEINDFRLFCLLKH